MAYRINRIPRLPARCGGGAAEGASKMKLCDYRSLWRLRRIVAQAVTHRSRAFTAPTRSQQRQAVPDH